MGMSLQLGLPGIPMPLSDNDPAPLDAPGIVLETLREMVLALLPVAPDHWAEKLRAGQFDNGPLMQAAIAGWMLGEGRPN
jgi:hypothetical protein